MLLGTTVSTVKEKANVGPKPSTVDPKPSASSSSRKIDHILQSKVDVTKNDEIVKEDDHGSEKNETYSKSEKRNGQS